MKKALMFISILILGIVGGVMGDALWREAVHVKSLSSYPHVEDGILAQTEHIIYPVDITEVKVNFTNHGTDIAGFFLENIQLERKVNDEWHTIPRTTEEDNFTLYGMQAGAPTTQITVNLEDFTQPLEAGEYRFVFLYDGDTICAVAGFELGTKPNTETYQINWNPDDLYAVVYLGYRGITDWEQELADYQDALEISYVFSQYEMGGDECFLVIPRYQESEITLNSLDMNDLEDAEGDLRYSQRNGEPFVVFCNQSDIFSNVKIDISCADEKASFSPQLSLRDGYMSEMERGQDLTKYDHPRDEDVVPPQQEETLLPILSMEFYFSSGAGAWGTRLMLNNDGRYYGTFGDSDGAIHYHSNFSGQFTDICALDDHSYSLTLGEVKLAYEVGKEEVVDDITYIASEPYGLENGTEFIFYDTDTPVEELPQGVRDWCHYDLESRNTLGCHALYNVSEELAFFSEEVLG